MKKFRLCKRALNTFMNYLGQRPARHGGYILADSYSHAVVEVQLSLEELPNDWMIVNEDELEDAEGIFDYYVACERIESDWIRILGTISPADFKRICVDRSKQYGPGKLGLLCKSLCALRPIDDFMKDFAS